MLKDIIWPEDRTYSSESLHEPIEFYLNALSNSNRFDLQLGYFSSAAIKVLSFGFASFLYNGGKMRIIANNILSADDAEIIRNSNLEKFNNDAIDLTDFDSIKSNLDEHSKHFLKCVSWLIAKERIEIVLIKPKGKKGISHNKTGVFYDTEGKVAFRASCNFTFFGLLENHEDLDVYLEETEVERKKIISQENRFEDIISGKASFVEYVDQSGIEVVIKEVLGDYDIEIGELLIEEKQLLAKLKEVNESPSVQKIISGIQKNVEIKMSTPRFPFPEGPRQYQLDAFESWMNNDKKGVFAMATGTGKTLTSLNCLLQEYHRLGTYKAIILVPTIALQNQWVKECHSFNFNRIISISSKYKWGEEVAFINMASRYIDTSFVVIATYASFAKSKFQSFFKNIHIDTLFIADEAHNLGATNVSKYLSEIHLNKRIGLSATPTRKYDELGNNLISQFFNDQSPYVFNYSMKKALENGFLCQYKYYPHVVELTFVELEEYERISKILLSYIDPKTGKYKDCEEVERLLLERKRIIHKAENKLTKFEQIIGNEFENRGRDLRYTLVYVPEGIEPNYDKSDLQEESDEDLSLINKFTKVVSKLDRNMTVSQFTSNTENREDILSDFQYGKIQVLTSMKCLDEGVDVPRAELAIFCSSSGNPRQFIQRRGRVLRNHKDKKFAVLHDLVVVPKLIGDSYDNTYSMERNLMKSELERVIDFSNLAMNKTDTQIILKEVLDSYNISLYE